MVVDSCPTCHNFNDVDTSTAVWNAISGSESPSMYTGNIRDRKLKNIYRLQSIGYRPTYHEFLSSKPVFKDHTNM